MNYAWYVERAGGILAYALLFGVIAAELLAALAVTNRYRTALPYRVWRRAHYLNFAVWLLALVHGIAAGTDRATVWALALYIGTASVVAGLTAARFTDTLTVWKNAQRWRQSSQLAGRLPDP